MTEKKVREKKNYFEEGKNLFISPQYLFNIFELNLLLNDMAKNRNKVCFLLMGA